MCTSLQFSDEEVEDMQCPWENPLFENTDQLMDERFAVIIVVYSFNA